MSKKSNLPALYDPMSVVEGKNDGIFGIKFPEIKFPEVNVPEMGIPEMKISGMKISEDKNNVYAKVHVPDSTNAKISASIKDGMLTISAEQSEKNEVKKKDFYRFESYQGSLFRQTRLPHTVDGKKTKVVHTKGMLEITMPKAGHDGKGEVKLKV